MKNRNEWKISDNTWNNFKRWFEEMEKVKDKKPFVTMNSIRSMINICDELTEIRDNKIDEIIDNILKNVKQGDDEKS